MDRYADFDEAFSEEAAEPLRIKLYGQEWELPATMPAAAVLRVTRFMAEGRDPEQDLTRAEHIDLAADLIPRETLNVWLAKGLDIDQLGNIVSWQMRQYLGAQDGDGQGEAQAPDGAPSSSSNGGDSSKPTSPASTGSN